MSIDKGLYFIYVQDAMDVDITRRRENAQGRIIWFGEVEWEEKLQ